MAGLQERKGSYRINFRYHGKQHFVTLGKVSEQEARAKSAQVSYLLLRLKQGLLELPAGVGILAFIQHDGRVPAAPSGNEIVDKALNLGALWDRYLDRAVSFSAGGRGSVTGHQVSCEIRTRKFRASLDQ